MVGEAIGKTCRRGHEIQVLKSGAGYYIGTVDEEGFPYCRISAGYSKTAEGCKDLVEDRAYAMEIWFCNGNKGCLNCAK